MVMKKMVCAVAIILFVGVFIQAQNIFEPVPMLVGFDTEIWQGVYVRSRNIRPIKKGEIVIA